MPVISRRRTLSRLFALGLFYPLVACSDGNHKVRLFVKKDIVLSVVLYSYLDRPIFDVVLDGSDIGVAGVADVDGGAGIISGITVPFGPQTLTWRDAGTGNTFEIKNSISLTAEQIPADAQYLAVNIYPDDTGEFVFDRYIPGRTPRGNRIIEERNRHGK